MWRRTAPRRAPANLDVLCGKLIVVDSSIGLCATMRCIIEMEYGCFLIEQIIRYLAHVLPVLANVFLMKYNLLNIDYASKVINY